MLQAMERPAFVSDWRRLPPFEALLPLGAALAAGVPGQGTWETTLQSRDINHDGTVDAFCDTVLNVTWLANANVAVGSSDVAPWAVGAGWDGMVP
jgi:hypothetical protein